jgi:hypothetical protein
MTHIACSTFAVSMRGLSDRPKLRQPAGRSVLMQPPVRKQIAQLQTELQAERSRGLLRRLFGLGSRTAEKL